MNAIWLRTALTLGAALLAGLLVWALAGPLSACAAALAVLLAALLRTTANLAALDAWSRDPKAGTVPAGSGAWKEAFSGLYRYVRSRDTLERTLGDDLERFRSAGLALPDGVILLDADGHIEWCNPIASDYFGLDQVRDPGRPLVNLVRQPDFVEYMERGEYIDPFTLRLARDRGALVLSLAVIAYGRKQKLLLARDVTLSEKVEIMRRDFVANVSHELKSPLTVVAGFLETLTDGDLKLEESRKRGYLMLMRDHTTRMQRLVEDLLTLSALESSPAPIEETWIDIAALLAEVFEEAVALSAGRHHVELQPGIPAQLLGNAKELRSAFGNLVSNAVRYSPDNGNISLTWELRSGQGVFSVVDSGIGIEPRHIPRLTERFYRVDNSRSRETGGTGLGLAIVKHVLTRHQATLEIVSVPGGGSRFSTVFPTHRVSAAMTNVETSQPAIGEDQSAMEKVTRS